MAGADDELVRRAIRARGDNAMMSAVWHGVFAALAFAVMVMGGQALPLALGGGGLAAVATLRGVQARRARRAQTAPLVMLLQAPDRVERITIVDDDDAGTRLLITVAGVSDHIVAPGKIDETLAVLRRRCPAATVEDRRSDVVR